MINPAAPPADDETARIGTEASPRPNGQRRRHQRARQSAAPPIASMTSSVPSKPRPTLSDSAEPPSAIASRKSKLSTIQSRRERRAGAASSSSGTTSLPRARRRPVITASLGGVTAVEQPTKVDPQHRLSSLDDRPAADCRNPASRPILSSVIDPSTDEQEIPCLPALRT